MKVLPVAFDSLGVRSMATYIETQDVKVFIDPGVSVAPDRYSLPPHQIELDRYHNMWKAVRRWVMSSDIIIVTHYHYDHHNPDEPELYEGKDVFLKHPREFINESQRERAAYFLSRIEPYAKAINIADNTHISFGKTNISFSKPVCHGASSRLGYVIQIFIEETERFIHTSDVCGPVNKDAVDFIIERQPHSIIVDGPLTYLLGSHYRKEDVSSSLENLKRIITETPIKNLVIDHHLLRDLSWHNYIDDLKGIKSSVLICSAAEFLGQKEELLEARRKEFYDAQGVKYVVGD
jgi:hypothetical protein